MRNLKNYRQLPFNPKLKEQARALRKAGNLSEVLLWQQVRGRKFKGYDFDRQKIIGHCIVDFYCLDCDVVIEIDGYSHEGKAEVDRQRDAFLESLGLTVVRVAARDVLKNLEGVMNWLHQHSALAQAQQGGINHPGPAGHPSREGNF